MITREQLTEQDKIRLTDSDSELEMFSYIKCDKDESDLIKQCRGLIFHNEELLVPSFGWTAEYTKDDKEELDNLLKTTENIRIFDSHEGCLLRIFNFNSKWYIATHRRLDAFKSRWSSKEYWGDMFVKALDQEMEQFLNSLDKTKIYFFVVRNNKENRLVCDVSENPEIFHVGTMYKNDEKWVTSFDEDIGIQHPVEYVLTENNTLENMISYVEEKGYKQIQGLVIFSNICNFKLCNKTYYDYLKIRGNEASIKFRYLQIRMHKDMREKLVFLYPNYKEDFEKYEEYLFKIALSLTKAYQLRFIRGQWKQVPKDEYESIIRPLRTWHLEDVNNNKIDLDTVINKLNEQSAQFLNKLIRRMKIHETHNTQSIKKTTYRLLVPGFAQTAN